MDIETRVTNLENMLASVVNSISNNKFYTDADIAGCRNTDAELSNQIEAVKPYEVTEKASVGDTEVTFVEVPNGITISTTVIDLEGHAIDHNTTKTGDIVKVFFEPLQYAADITLRIE